MKQQQVDVCLATFYFYPVYAGPAVRFHRYEPGLRQRGVHMRVFAGTSPEEGSDKTAPRQPVGTLLAPEEVDGIPVQRVQMPPESMRSQYLTYNAALAKYCRQNRPDLIQFLSLSIYSIPSLYRLRWMGIPLVYTNTMLGEWATSGWKSWLQRLYIPRPFQMMDCVVVSSSVMRDGLREVGVSARIDVIPNGVNIERFHPVRAVDERSALREKLGLPVDADLIVFVGSISPRKGLDVLAEAWALMAQKYPRAYLVLVGPGYTEIRPGASVSEFEAKIKDALARSGAEDRVIFTGSVDNVEHYLQAADMFVFPSRREGMPNVVPEAYGCGIPCILTPFIGLPDEFGRAGEHYELVERTPEALADAISKLLDSPERREELGKQGRKWVEQEMSVERSLDQYTALYRELADRSKANLKKE